MKTCVTVVISDRLNIIFGIFVQAIVSAKFLIVRREDNFQCIYIGTVFITDAIFSKATGGMKVKQEEQVPNLKCDNLFDFMLP